MRRIVSIWLPRWPTDRRHRARRQAGSSLSAGPDDKAPFVLSIREKSAVRLASLNEAAEKAGLRAGMTLADARAVLPGLKALPLSPKADAKALRALALWSGRYTPWTAVDGDGGVIMDISGCAHLFGGKTVLDGEAALLRDLSSRLGAMGLTHCIGLAGTRGAAWGLARYGDFGEEPWLVLPPGAEEERVPALLALPVAALRLDGESCETLWRLGLKTIAALARLPRMVLQHRFSGRRGADAVLKRLDQFFGREGEPVQPISPAPPFRTRHSFPEPVEGFEAVWPVLTRQVEDICTLLEAEGKGVRRLAVETFHVDGTASRMEVRTAAASRSAGHLTRLFREKLETATDSDDSGSGGSTAGFAVADFSIPIDEVILSCLEVEAMRQRQASLLREAAADGEADGLFELVDRLSARFGGQRVGQLQPHQSHIPERACRRISGLGPPGSWDQAGGFPGRRPFRLFSRPEIINVMAEIPDGPPLSFRWRRMLVRVTRAEGPERITPEWWQGKGSFDGSVRDYYHLEDSEGCRFWVYRDGLFGEPGPGQGRRWYMHGLFA